MEGFAGGKVVGQEQLIWMTGNDSEAHNASPVPLALLPPGNIYREHAIEGLERMGRTWRIACVSESVAGLQAAVFAGMAVTVLGRSALVPGMREIGVSEYFPPLPAVDLLLYRASGRNLAAIDALHNYLENYLAPPAQRLGIAGGRGCTAAGAATASATPRNSSGRSRFSAAPGRTCAHGRAASNAAAIRKMTASSSQGATTCSPIGRPSWSKPQGTLAAGSPARLIGHENGDQPRCRSTAAPSISSTPMVPASKAVTATVGVTSASTDPNKA